MSERNEIEDIYSDDNIQLWHDGEWAYLTIQNVTIGLPLLELEDILGGLCKSLTFWQLRMIEMRGKKEE